jgi:hypothetical protein
MTSTKAAHTFVWAVLLWYSRRYITPEKLSFKRKWQINRRGGKMAKPVYQLFTARFTEAWYQLSKDEQDQVLAKQAESSEKASSNNIIFAESVWSNEEWQFFGVNEYPNLEALQEHTARLIEIGWFRYIDSKVILGKEYEQG